MAFSDTPNRLEAVFIQRDTSNVRYDQINISGSDLIVYLDGTGSINADKIATWAAKYGIGLGGSGSAASASWATNSIHAISANFATSSLSASWASQSLSSSYALTASEAIHSISASYFSGSQITASSILVGLILPLSSSIGNDTMSFSTIYATKLFGTASWATHSFSASLAQTASIADSLSFVPQVALSASWASQSFSSTSASYGLTASYALNGGLGSTGSVAFSASNGMLALDGNLWGYVPRFVSSGHMSASQISSADEGTIGVYASTLSNPGLKRVFYIGRDGNVNTWATLGFYNDAGGTNAKYWLNYADNANALEYSAVSDDFSIISPWLTVSRSGSAITQILFQRAVTINGNLLPVSSLTHSLGTGSLIWKSAWISQMFGTASVATSSFTASYISSTSTFDKSVYNLTASWANTASVLIGSVQSSTFAVSASWASQSLSSSYAGTASILLGSIESSSFAITASFAISSSAALTAISAAFATTASHAFTALRSISSSFASSSLSASFVTGSNVVGTVTSASYSFSASYAPGNPAISASYALSASYSDNSLTSSFTLGNVQSANTAISSSWASQSLSASFANNATSASYAGTASILIGSIDSATYALSASFASRSLSSSWALTSSYPWSASIQGNPYHNVAAVGIGTATPTASRLSVLETTSNHISFSIVSIQGTRSDANTMSLEIRNLSTADANASAGIRIGLGIGNEGGTISVNRTATPSFGIVKGLNISTNAADTDIGIRTGAALSGSVAGTNLLIKSDGTIGMGVATTNNARLHLGGTDLAFYNATLRMTNGAAGGADVFFAPTDNSWGGNIAGKLLIGTGDPGGGTQIMQLYPPSASVGIGIQSNVTPQAKLHVQGNISASSVTASLYGTASWAQNAVLATTATTASYALTASALLGSITSASYALSASHADVTDLALTATTASYSISASAAFTASYAYNATSASYAPSAPSISASYALTASFALNAGGTAVSSRAMVLCAAFTPFLTGADSAELLVPYSADGVTPLSWSVNRLNLRVQLSASATTASVTIQKCSSTGSFVSDLTLGDMTLNSQSYQTFTGSLVHVVSGDKVRFFVNDIGLSQYWTITTEVSSL